MVTFHEFQNIYEYDSATLWIAYGTATFFATFAVVIGLTMIIVSGASYDTSFSTVVRVSRHAQLTTTVTASDSSGHQPLPKHLARARISLGPSMAERESRAQIELKAHAESNSLLTQTVREL